MRIFGETVRTGELTVVDRMKSSAYTNPISSGNRRDLIDFYEQVLDAGS
jgi:hypothetical protein